MSLEPCICKWNEPRKDQFPAYNEKVPILHAFSALNPITFSDKNPAHLQILRPALNQFTSVLPNLINSDNFDSEYIHFKEFITEQFPDKNLEETLDFSLENCNELHPSITTLLEIAAVFGVPNATSVKRLSLKQN